MVWATKPASPNSSMIGWLIDRLPISRVHSSPNATR